MIEIKHITKKFHNKNTFVTANSDISFTIGDGQIYGILGQNGSGKTTLISQITGLYKIEEGDILIDGKSVRKNPKLGRTACAVQVQSQLSFGELTPRKIVTLMGEFRGGKPEVVRQETERLFQALAIEEWADKAGSLLSGGVKRLTAFCMAAVCPGKYIILDEPTNDVDPVRRKYLWQEIRRLAGQGCSVVVVTHNILELENVVDTVAIINDGLLVSEGAIEEIKRHIGNELNFRLFLTVSAATLPLPDWTTKAVCKEEILTLSISPSLITEAVSWAKALIKQELALNYSLTEATLEDAYINLIEKGA